MAKRAKTTEADVWKLIAEHFAGADLVLDKVANQIYTNAKGEVKIDQPRETEGKKGAEEKQKVKEQKVKEKTSGSEGQKDEGTEAGENANSTTDFSNVIDLLKGRSTGEAKKTTTKAVEDMNHKEFKSYYDEMINS